MKPTTLLALMAFACSFESRHCGNRVTFVVVGADGGAESVTYEDQPCQEQRR